MTSNLILLDGAKGAGKSSVGEILTQRLDNAVYLSLDNERRSLKNKEKNRTELNKEAFENIIYKTKRLLSSKNNIIIDCGLTKERLIRLESFASETGVNLYKFFLKADHDILLNRVRYRDNSRGKSTDVERFNEVHKIVHDKELDSFYIIETNQIDLKKVASMIITTINQGSSNIVH